MLPATLFKDCTAVSFDGGLPACNSLRSVNRWRISNHSCVLSMQGTVSVLHGTSRVDDLVVVDHRVIVTWRVCLS